ncbi:MAG: hypothetical protein JJE52_07000 [Acidimicrobiia bacterium]|nr:hypothetical protein [Acidimicrobiia bacterium]
MFVPVTPSLPSWLSTATSTTFGAIARVRHARGLHPRGVTLAGRASLTMAGRPLTTVADSKVVVRLSRGIGLPHPWPDFNGIAIRFVDAHGAAEHLDLLLTSSFSPPRARHLIFPWSTLDGLGYSTVLTFDGPDGTIMFRAELDGARTLDALDVAREDAVHIRVMSARPDADWVDAARIQLDRVLAPDEAAAVRFDPWVTSTSLVLRGLLNRLRGPAYAGSRENGRAVA